MSTSYVIDAVRTPRGRGKPGIVMCISGGQGIATIIERL
jgi:acetyl-CoA acetyltransferase